MLNQFCIDENTQGIHFWLNVVINANFNSKIFLGLIKYIALVEKNIVLVIIDFAGLFTKSKIIYSFTR